MPSSASITVVVTAFMGRRTPTKNDADSSSFGRHQPSSVRRSWSAAPQCRTPLWRSHLCPSNAPAKNGDSAASHGGTEVPHSQGLHATEKNTAGWARQERRGGGGEPALRKPSEMDVTDRGLPRSEDRPRHPAGIGVSAVYGAECHIFKRLSEFSHPPRTPEKLFPAPRTFILDPVPVCLDCGAPPRDTVAPPLDPRRTVTESSRTTSEPRRAVADPNAAAWQT